MGAAALFQLNWTPLSVGQPPCVVTLELQTGCDVVSEPEGETGTEDR